MRLFSRKVLIKHLADSIDVKLIVRHVRNTKQSNLISFYFECLFGVANNWRLLFWG
jgi:hypothetical protein